MTKSVEPSAADVPAEEQNNSNARNGGMMGNNPTMMNGMSGQMPYGFNNGMYGMNGMPNMMGNGNWSGMNAMGTSAAHNMTHAHLANDRQTSTT